MVFAVLAMLVEEVFAEEEVLAGEVFVEEGVLVVVVAEELLEEGVRPVRVVLVLKQVLVVLAKRRDS